MVISLKIVPAYTPGARQDFLNSVYVPAALVLRSGLTMGEGR